MSCKVCFLPTTGRAEYCERCNVLRVRNPRRYRMREKVNALRNSWDGQNFKCYYSGIALKTNRGYSNDPKYLTYDHVIPGEDNLVVCAAFINDMKSDLTEDEFRHFVKKLAAHFNGKTPNNWGIKFRCWRRSVPQKCA
jgi:hypothetical protein